MQYFLGKMYLLKKMNALSLLRAFEKVKAVAIIAEPPHQLRAFGLPKQ